MTLRIERNSRGGSTVLKLVGQIRSSDIEEVTAQMRNGDSPAVLDLDELSLVDAAVVRFLGGCEDGGLELRNCPPYIREWIKREKDRE
jgi:anti-anti-sigma regulatory factor